MNKIDSSVKFHIYQCVWVFMLALVTTSFTEGFHALFTPWGPYVWLGMIHLGILSSAVAFLIQIRAQKVIPPTQFGLLVLLESPWALCFSLILGMEVITHFQILGAILILLAAALESLSAFDLRTAMAKAKSRR
jgi:drug/metabolite transporter (DMT)-like permease